MMAPVMVMPVPVVPVTTMPAVVTPVVMVVTVMPTHLHGFQPIDFALRDDRRFNVDQSGHGQRVARDRRYGRGLCARSQQDRARDQSGTELQEIPKFHHLMPLSRGERRRAVSPHQDERSLNSHQRLRLLFPKNGSNVRVSVTVR